MTAKHSLLTLTILLLFTFQAIADEASNKASVESADNWLKLVDSGKYGESWDHSALTMKLTVSKPQWIALMKAIRGPLGASLSRKLIEQRPAKDPEKLPKGDYMVLFFQSDFSQKKNAHELVTQVQESDGKWRVLTYQVQ